MVRMSAYLRTIRRWSPRCFTTGNEDCAAASNGLDCPIAAWSDIVNGNVLFVDGGDAGLG